MKQRHAFVSNSSSSSYILAIRKDVNKCNCCGRSDPNFLDEVEKSQWSKTEIVARGFEEVYGEWQQYWGDPESEKIRNIADLYMNDKWIIAEVNIAYGDEKLKNMLKNSGENVVVLHNEDDE